MVRVREQQDTVQTTENLLQEQLTAKGPAMESISTDYSAAEINLKRLLRKCEQLEKEQQMDWRFEKYVDALQHMFASVKTTAEAAVKKNDPLLARITDYKSRVDHLRRISRPDLYSEENDRRQLLDKRSDSQYADGVKSNTGNLQSLTTRRIPDEPVIPQDSGDFSKAIDFSSSSSDFRPAPPSPKEKTVPVESFRPSSRDLDILVSHEMGRQEQVTDEMLTLAQALKANMTTANQLVRRDFKIIDKATTVADKNYTRLEKENAKLAEQTKNNTSWWVLFFLIGLFGVFVMMVLFMRLFPKPRTSR